MSKRKKAERDHADCKLPCRYGHPACIVHPHVHPVTNECMCGNPYDNRFAWHTPGECSG